MAEELLSLSTIVDKATVNITSKKHPRGKQYELVDLDDLSPLDHQKIVVKHADATTLMQTEGVLTPTQSRSLEKLLGDIVKILIPTLEPIVLRDLSNGQRSRILRVWAARNSGGGEGGATPTRSRTTAASSRRSKSSTAATRNPGRTRRTG
jgi:hypothetical protein